MKYSKEDIHFEQITPKGFENLCYDLIVKYNFYNLVWREGGADSGRDIEGSYTFVNTVRNKVTKWFFECKHYTSGGVPPEHLASKIAWADAECPDSLVILCSSYLTNGSRIWIDKIAPQKQYEIICIEGEELKDRLLNYPDLIERYFSLTRYEQMLKDIKDYKNKFNINPSFEILKEIIENIDLAKLDTDDFGFILINFYEQYEFFVSRTNFYDDFDVNIMNRIFIYFESSIAKDQLLSFIPYKDNYTELGGTGFMDEMLWIEDEDKGDYEIKSYNFQFYHLHLNHNREQEHWKIGKYLFVIHQATAFEIFKTEKTEIRIIRDFTPQKIEQVSLKLDSKFKTTYKKYIEYISV